MPTSSETPNESIANSANRNLDFENIEKAIKSLQQLMEINGGKLDLDTMACSTVSVQCSNGRPVMQQ